jgi:hypothetical protein
MMGIRGENNYAQMMDILTSASPRNWAEIAAVVEGLPDSVSSTMISQGVYYSKDKMSRMVDHHLHLFVSTCFI